MSILSPYITVGADLSAIKQAAKVHIMSCYAITNTTYALVNPQAKVTAILNAPHRVAELNNDIMSIIDIPQITASILSSRIMDCRG